MKSKNELNSNESFSFYKISCVDPIANSVLSHMVNILTDPPIRFYPNGNNFDYGCMYDYDSDIWSNLETFADRCWPRYSAFVICSAISESKRSKNVE